MHRKIKAFQELEKILKVEFTELELLKTALTHSSFANEKVNKGSRSYERLEFLGDSILSIVVTEYLYVNYPDLPEGELTKVRSSTVCEYTLAKCARSLQLGEFLLLGKGERLSGGYDRESILADAVEAIIGAIFLDQGFDGAKRFVLDLMVSFIEQYVDGEELRDYKTILQELVQVHDYSTYYEIVNEKGPAHDKLFTAHVIINKKIRGVGKGKTKKEAEQVAAKQAYDEISKTNKY